MENKTDPETLQVEPADQEALDAFTRAMLGRFHGARRA